MKHGMRRTSEYTIWAGIIQRCDNTKLPTFPRYGGRGISYDPRWKDFGNFIADVGRRPSKEHTLDRIDNNGNYSKENCRWATWKEQNRNRRNSPIYVHQGLSKTLSEWAETFGLPYKTIWQRFGRGWRGDLLFSPLGPTAKRNK